ncbi:hypothetical protein HK102_008712, partial [Quaeritorhiza haematococci]
DPAGQEEEEGKASTTGDEKTVSGDGEEVEAGKERSGDATDEGSGESVKEEETSEDDGPVLELVPSPEGSSNESLEDSTEPERVSLSEEGEENASKSIPQQSSLGKDTAPGEQTKPEEDSPQLPTPLPTPSPNSSPVRNGASATAVRETESGSDNTTTIRDSDVARLLQSPPKSPSGGSSPAAVSKSPSPLRNAPSSSSAASPMKSTPTSQLPLGDSSKSQSVAPSSASQNYSTSSPPPSSLPSQPTPSRRTPSSPSQQTTRVVHRPYPYLYRLQAVVIHYGSHDSGHFVTFRRVPVEPRPAVSEYLGKLGLVEDEEGVKNGYEEEDHVEGDEPHDEEMGDDEDESSSSGLANQTGLRKRKGKGSSSSLSTSGKIDKFASSVSTTSSTAVGKSGKPKKKTKKKKSAAALAALKSAESEDGGAGGGGESSNKKSASESKVTGSRTTTTNESTTTPTSSSPTLPVAAGGIQYDYPVDPEKRWRETYGEDQWYRISDDRVELVQDVETYVFGHGSAYVYMLFYEKV